MNSEISREASRLSTTSSGSQISKAQLEVAHARLRKLQELDETTKIPFILIELRGHGPNDGYIEVCGKDEYGVHDALGEWLASTWRCTQLDAGDLSDGTPLPFSDALYRWEGFLSQGKDGTSNMGLATMQLVDFMCRTLSWTLAVINGGNVGSDGSIREQQLIFKAPHPMNLSSHHMMVELRSAGFIEVCGSSREAKDVLHGYFTERMDAKACRGHQMFCDRYYSCQNGVFKERGRSGYNNLGQLTTQVCDDIVKLLPGWSLVTMNGGNYGEDGMHREQQLVFRWDNHPLRENPHLLVELREAGFIEVCGQDVDGIHKKLLDWLHREWSCKEAKAKKGEFFCDKMVTWRPMDMMVASAELTGFFHEHGWQMQVCSQGTVAITGNADAREQQIIFRSGASGKDFVEPHLFIELYTGEGVDELYSKPEVTQLLGNQRIRIRPVGDCRSALTELDGFVSQYLGGERMLGGDTLTYTCDVFLSRGLTDNNLGCWSMRLCDFMVDRLGWSFVVCNVCNLGTHGVCREQQLVFRFDGERRDIPAVREHNALLEEIDFVGLEFPSYWVNEKVLGLKQPVANVSCTPTEVEALQEVLDATFKRTLTRDRVYEYQLGVAEEMPYRLEVIHAFRSEHAELYRRFMEKRTQYTGGTPMEAKTHQGGKLLNDRLGHGESLLLHGTNPSSAMAVLKSGFSLSKAGKSTGTMFGYGMYLAECSSKSDEYARDDNGGTFPGLMALLVCRCLVGRPYVVQDAGDHVAEAKSAGCDCVVGDREAKVGTYREFVFSDERQVLPEYAVIYRRQYDQGKVPQLMRQNTRGTTGKNWQVQLEKGWANMSPDVSHELNTAQKEGLASLERSIANASYKFDLANFQQINTHTGVARRIRAPMRR